MTQYRPEQTELPLSSETEEVFARFNEQLDKPERLAHIIGVTALGYAETLDDDDRKLAATVLDVLKVTKNGTALDASEATWAAIYADSDHRAARRDVHTTTDPIDLQIAIRRRGFCALRAIALAQLSGEMAEQAPTLEDIEKEIVSTDTFAVV